MTKLAEEQCLKMQVVRYQLHRVLERIKRENIIKVLGYRKFSPHICYYYFKYMKLVVPET